MHTTRRNPHPKPAALPHDSLLALPTLPTQKMLSAPLILKSLLVSLLTPLLVSLPILCATPVWAADLPGKSSGEPSSEAASALLAKHSTLATQLAQSSFRRALVLQSAEEQNTVRGDAYAVLDAPFDSVKDTFKNPSHWCDVMILHLNTKYCRAASQALPSRVKVYVGNKTPQALADAFGIDFVLESVADSAGYLAMNLHADKGPLGTQNYALDMQAVPLPNGKTFMHLRYAYGFGMAGRFATQAYLATLGSGKVGFSSATATDGVALVGGLRGMVERNTMRYFLAIEAYLASMALPAAGQQSARLERWFDATEIYARQLHEIERGSYLEMKKDELQRQQTAQ